MLEAPLGKHRSRKMMCEPPSCRRVSPMVVYISILGPSRRSFNRHPGSPATFASNIVVLRCCSRPLSIILSLCLIFLPPVLRLTFSPFTDTSHVLHHLTTCKQNGVQQWGLGYPPGPHPSSRGPIPSQHTSQAAVSRRKEES